MILEALAPPGAKGTPEVQMAASEPTLREAPGAKEPMEALPAGGPTLRYVTSPALTLATSCPSGLQSPRLPHLSASPPQSPHSA